MTRNYLQDPFNVSTTIILSHRLRLQSLSLIKNMSVASPKNLLTINHTKITLTPLNLCLDYVWS